MAKTSFIYQNIHYYRFVMSLLYKGNYYKRFKPVADQISGKRVTEICFGDVVIAEYCKSKSIDWTGIDINDAFIKNAQKQGLNAQKQDILDLNELPAADTCIICGSLYHFNNQLESLFVKMLACAPKIIISEPINNLSTNKGIIGKLAKASANVNGKKHDFRFTQESLLLALTELSNKLKFEFSVVGQLNKDIIIVIKK